MKGTSKNKDCAQHFPDGKCRASPESFQLTELNWCCSSTNFGFLAHCAKLKHVTNTHDTDCLSKLFTCPGKLHFSFSFLVTASRLVYSAFFKCV